MEHDEITFEGAGHYWLTDGEASSDLGVCTTHAELAHAVRTCMDAGDEDWSGWYTELRA